MWFSVRARALGSFVGGLVAVIAGNILGYWLDRVKIPLKIRSRGAFWTIVTLQGAWWIWATVKVTEFRRTQPTYDWATSGFSSSFPVFVFLTLGFQLNYLFLYFIIHNLAQNQQEVIRYSALLRGTESAWQAVSYGLESIRVFGEVGGVYMNFGLWALAILPAWLVLRHFGALTSSVEDATVSETVQTEKAVSTSNSDSGEDKEVK